MLISFKNRKVLVTGGTRGIGAEIARLLAEAGAAEIYITGRDREKADQLQKEAAARKQPFRYLAADFENPASVEKFAAEIAGRPFDVLINNAGINIIAKTEEVDAADWQRIQQVNVNAPFVLCKTLAKGMAARRYGRIVNISSIFGHVSKAKRVSYSTSKFALLGMTKAMALDYAADNVLVNTVAPGFIDTELTRGILGEKGIAELVKQVPAGRLGTAEEIARVVLFLASDANTFITGQSVIADGGFTSA